MPYEGVVGETALTFDASAVVFFVISDSIFFNVIRSFVHSFRTPTAGQLCIQPRLLLFQRYVTLWFLQPSARGFTSIRSTLLIVFAETLFSCQDRQMCRRIERLVDLELTTEIGFRDMWERRLEVILGGLREI